MTDECGKLKETGTFIRTRPYQYSKTPQLELDSYVTFTQAVKLRVRQYCMYIQPETFANEKFRNFVKRSIS